MAIFRVVLCREDLILMYFQISAATTDLRIIQTDAQDMRIQSRA